jgi:hypothetical protein
VYPLPLSVSLNDPLPEYFKDDSLEALLAKTDSLATIQLSLAEAILFEFLRLWTSTSSNDRLAAELDQVAKANAKVSAVTLPPNCMCFTLYPQFRKK